MSQQEVMIAKQMRCPTCGKKGRAVGGATVKSMLAVSLRHVRDTAYRFCSQADCDVVYYSGDGAQTFTTAQVRERVYQKEPHADDVLICGCFRYTPGDLRRGFAQAAVTAIIEDIQAGVQAGQCACDCRNPQGSCCLGNVLRFVRQLETAAPPDEGE